MAQFRNRFLVSLLGLLLVFTFVGCGEDEEEKKIVEVSKAAYILNGTAETISVFDIETSVVQNDALSVGKWPADIKIHGDKAYVANTGDNSVQIIDLESLTDAGIIDVGDGTMPEKIGFVSDNKAYVSCNGTGAVKVLDLASQQATTEIKVEAAPWGVDVVSGKVYVCNTNATYDVSAGAMVYGGGTVSVIDTSTDQVVKTIDVETNPTEVVSFQGKLVVLCTGNYADIIF